MCIALDIWQSPSTKATLHSIIYSMHRPTDRITHITRGNQNYLDFISRKHSVTELVYLSIILWYN